jgi:hypothetical protein
MPTQAKTGLEWGTHHPRKFLLGGSGGKGEESLS